MTSSNALAVSRLALGLSLLGLVLATGASLSAQEYSLFDKANVSLNFGFVGLNTTFRLDSQLLGTGTEIDFEKDLGLSSSEAIPALFGEWRIKRRHLLRWAYMNIDRDSSQQVATEIRFGDIVVPVNEFVTLDFDVQTFLLGYDYFPILKDRVAFGVGGG